LKGGHHGEDKHHKALRLGGALLLETVTRVVSLSEAIGHLGC